MGIEESKIFSRPRNRDSLDVPTISAIDSSLSLSLSLFQYEIRFLSVVYVYICFFLYVLQLDNLLLDFTTVLFDFMYIRNVYITVAFHPTLLRTSQCASVFLR